MTQINPVNYNLNVSKTDPVTQQTQGHLNLGTTDAKDLMRLLDLCGQNDEAGRKYNLSISATATDNSAGVDVTVATNTTLQADNAGFLARILSLSGVTGSEMTSDDSCGCEAPEEGAMSMPAMEMPIAMMEQQAAYDYGHKDYIEDQEEFTITDYNFRGRADLPERLTSAQFGSNALKNEMKESAFDQIKNKYLDFLNEARENDAGYASPLTANARDEFDKDPLAKEEVVDDGTRSPLSRIERQELPD
jgi:hypothetical protein